MPTIVGILTFMSMINLCLVELSMEKYNLGPCGHLKINLEQALLPRIDVLMHPEMSK